MDSLIYVLHDDWLYSFERSDKHSASFFGGPLDVNIGGKPFGPRPLHLVAWLGGYHIPALSESYIQHLPLIYGMHYNGCEMSYRVDGRRIELLDLIPATSSEDCPYPNFPPLLPFVPLRLDDAPNRSNYEEFSNMFDNMPERQRTELIVAVPPPATLGLSLWGSSGDAEGVTIVFECDLQEKTVHSFNVVS